MADLISRQPPRPYALPGATQTSGNFGRQQYARPEVLISKKKGSSGQLGKAQNLANRIQQLRGERLQLLFPDAPPGASINDYPPNEIANAQDSMPPDLKERYNWLIEKDQQLRSQLTDIVGTASTSSASQSSKPTTRTATRQKTQTQSQFSSDAQQVIDKYAKGNRINISQMAKDAVSEGYSDYKGGKDIKDKWNKVAKELGIGTEFSQATEFAAAQKIYGDRSGRIDIEKMIADGYSQEYLNELAGIEEQQYKDIKTTSGYKTDQGNIDVTKMVKELPQEDVQRIMGITDSEYKDLQTVAAHTDAQGNVDVATLIDYGYSYDLLNRVLGLSKEDYNTINQKVSARNQLAPYLDDKGQLDLLAAVEADKLDVIQQVYDIKNEDVAKALDYLELKDKGYVDSHGNVDVMQVIVDGKVDERTLTNALNIKTDDLGTYKTVAKYVDADGNIDIMSAVKDNALPDIQKVVDVPQDDLAKVFDYLELEDKGYVDQSGKVNILNVIKDGKVDQRTLTNAIGLSTSEYDEYATLAKYMDSEGNIDVMKALDQGVKPELLQKHLDVDMKEIEAIQEQQAAMGELTKYLDTGVGDKPMRSKEARQLKNPKVDVLSAIADGVEYETLNRAIGLEKDDYDNLKEVSKYTDAQGNIDVVKALYHGADPDMLQEQLNISDKEMKELEDYAKYEYWEPRYTPKTVEEIDKMVDGKWNANEKAAIKAALVEAGALDQSVKQRINDIGVHKTSDIEKVWNNLSDEDKQKVANLYMTWYDRTAATNMPLVDASFNALEKAVDKVSKSDVTLPTWAHNALIGVFPVLGAGGYASVLPDDKYESLENKRAAAQSAVHKYVNPEFLHSLSQPDKDWKDGSPAKRFGHNIVSGITDILLALSMDIPVAVQSASEKYQRKDYEASASEMAALGGGMLLFPATLAKKTLKDAPAGAGYTIGSLVLPTRTLKAVYKTAGKARTYADPYGIPDRMAAIEFATGRVPVRELSPRLLQDLVTQASKDILSGKESGSFKQGGWKITYRTTPIQRANASAVFHGSPDVTPMAKLKPGDTFVVDPTMHLFTSVYATPRFVASTSRGVAGSKPGYAMIITNANKLMTTESKVPGVTGPYKTYKGAVETEVVANPKSGFTRAQNLRTRILGPKAGEFFTQYMGPDAPGIRSGKLVPIVVLLDKGITKKPLSPATLYAAKLTMIREALIDYATALKHPKRTISDIINRPYGPPGVREMEISRLAKELESKAVENVLKKDLKDQKLLKGQKLEDALRAELERQFKIEADRIYRELGNKSLEQYYSTPEGQRRYEELYVRHMESVLRDAIRSYETAEALTRTATEYAKTEPRITLEATSLETERKLPEEQYIMTVKRRQSLREHPRVSTDEARVTDDRAIVEARMLSEPVNTRQMTAAARAELRGGRSTTSSGATPYVVPYQTSTVKKTAVKTVPPDLPYKGVPWPRPISPKKKMVTKELPVADDKKKRREKRPGTIHWRQGLWWISLIPRGRDKYVKVYSKSPPPGAPRKKRTPEETFFIKGGPDNIPARIKVDMGLMDVKIKPTGEPNLKFLRG